MVATCHFGSQENQSIILLVTCIIRCQTMELSLLNCTCLNFKYENYKLYSIKPIHFIRIIKWPVWLSLLVGESSCTPKGYGFDTSSERLAKWGVWFLVREPIRSNQSMFLSDINSSLFLSTFCKVNTYIFKNQYKSCLKYK